VIRRCLRIGLWLGVLGGIAFAVVRALERRPDLPAARPNEPWPPLPDTLEESVPWVEPEAGACPATHPVKAKLSSKIFHLPGMANYERTNPDRCYLGAAEAEADGLRPAKR
jgi:hypothetical protein